MARIAGINIPQNKLVHIGLTYIYGIGDKFSNQICSSLEIPRAKRVNELTDDEILKIREYIDANFKVEGEVIHCFDGTNTVGKAVCDLHSEASDFFFNEVKTLIADIFGKHVDDVTYDILLKAADKSQPLKGVVVEYSAWKKDPAKPFVKKKCKGRITEAEFKAKATPENYERYVASCRFKKEEPSA